MAWSGSQDEGVHNPLTKMLGSAYVVKWVGDELERKAKENVRSAVDWASPLRSYGRVRARR
jgi:hypothetical protein